MNWIIKDLKILIFCLENGRFSSLVLLRSGFTIERAEKPFGIAVGASFSNGFVEGPIISLKYEENCPSTFRIFF